MASHSDPESRNTILTEAAQQPQPDSYRSHVQTPAEKTSALLRTLWERNLPLLRARLAVMDEAATAARFGTLGEGLRAEACSTAHKLAGSLGMFGYPEGTRLARELEYALLPADQADPDGEALSRLTVELHSALGIDLPAREPAT